MTGVVGEALRSLGTKLRRRTQRAVSSGAATDPGHDLGVGHMGLPAGTDPADEPGEFSAMLERSFEELW